ncbi:hypothetical protein [Rosistilla oblonga]|uniref:hypothetical protein n=1 Tax=Rosistilla oblonga TaxID=2527990 RepID=UPI003A985E95
MIPWTIHNDGEGYEIANDHGIIVASFATPEAARSHHAMALAEGRQLRYSLRMCMDATEENERLRSSLESCLRILESVEECKIADERPVLREVLPVAIRDVKKALGKHLDTP